VDGTTKTSVPRTPHGDPAHVFSVTQDKRLISYRKTHAVQNRFTVFFEPRC
jgi:hypothetical protein